jgi:hypothetical protein
MTRGWLLRAALRDAAEYRRDHGDCTTCAAGECGDHASDDALAAAYESAGDEMAGGREWADGEAAKIGGIWAARWPGGKDWTS